MDLDKFDSIMQNDRNQEHTTNKYSLIPTTQVVKVLENNGWNPVLAGEMKCRSEDRKGFQKHIIKFRNDAVTIANKDHIQPEIILTNSHDGLASFQLQAGLYRFVCGNGCIVADSVFASISIKHIGYTDRAVELGIEEICDSVPTISNKVNQFQIIDLTPDEKGCFAQAALIAKYGEDEVKEREFNKDSLLRPVRIEDASPSLWNTFNICQEKLLKGSKFEHRTNAFGRKKTVKARGVNSITESIRLNKALWFLTEKMAMIKECQGGI
jgi:hypothetical protein